MEEIYDVVCVGGGISGLFTVKYMLSEGLSVIALEKEEEIGGVWRFKESPGGVIKSTMTTSSKTVTEFSDHYFKKQTQEPDFPMHYEFQEYLLDYVNEFNLRKHIVFNSEIVKAEKINEIWHVTDSCGRIFKGKNLVVASGANSLPNETPQIDEKLKSFNGPIYHSSVYKEPKPEFCKRLLMIGGGESSADIATELSYHTDNVYLSISNGQWFGVRRGGPTNFPLEHFSSKLRRWILNGDKNPELFSELKRHTEEEAGFHGHGIEVWRSPFDPYATSFINKNTQVLERIKEGFVHPKPALQRVEGNMVYFVDGSSAEIDVIMKCTGYQSTFPWLQFPSPEMQKDFCVSKMYKMTIHPDDTSLAFIGFVRPVRGSIPSGAEMQAWLYSKVLSGKFILPSNKEMKEIIYKEIRERKSHFGDANNRIRTLVQVYEYCDDIARMIGVYPNYFKLFFQVGPMNFWKIIRAPFHMSQYRLQTKQEREHHLKMIERFLPQTPFNIIIFCVMGRIRYSVPRLLPYFLFGSIVVTSSVVYYKQVK